MCWLIRRRLELIPQLLGKNLKLKDLRGGCISFINGNACSTNACSEQAFVKECQVNSEAQYSRTTGFLACPICLEPLSCSSHPTLIRQISTQERSSIRCLSCCKEYHNRDCYIDLTLDSNLGGDMKNIPFGLQLFRTRWLSMKYERGWRKSFEKFGFPGPVEEVNMAKKFLTPGIGGVLVDASCGTGLHSRLFAKLGIFRTVIASDYSEAMLQRCYEFIEEGESLLNEKILLVRADISRLPFATRSIDAVYAGAALHCWSSPSAGVAEINRVLKPGGVFIATTFLPRWKYRLQKFQSVTRQVASNVFGTMVFFFENELDELFMRSGFLSYKKLKIDSYIMVIAYKREFNDDAT